MGKMDRVFPWSWAHWMSHKSRTATQSPFCWKSKGSEAWNRNPRSCRGRNAVDGLLEGSSISMRLLTGLSQVSRHRCGLELHSESWDVKFTHDSSRTNGAALHGFRSDTLPVPIDKVFDTATFSLRVFATSTRSSCIWLHICACHLAGRVDMLTVWCLNGGESTCLPEIT